MHEGLGQVPAQLPLYDVELLGEEPGRTERAAVAFEPPDGVGPHVLRLLVLDAARRARLLLIALLHGTPEPELLDEEQDIVRLTNELNPVRPDSALG